MNEKTIETHHHFSFKHISGKWLIKNFLLLMFMLSSATVFGQESRTVKGLVLDSEGLPVIGATIVIQGTVKGNVTNTNGEFSIEVLESDDQTLLIAFVGMLSQQVSIAEKNYVEIVLITDIKQLEDVVVVGYGKQKKESVVGAISQTTGEELLKSGNVTNIGAALTGNIPGLITIQGTGEPGSEEPLIFIRGQGTWNDSEPLVLVDGIERSMSEVDFKSVEKVSVLKDASATAVFGVKGANGVILITTKRGTVGKAKIEVSANATMKIPSKLIGKYDSYGALEVRNMAIERELGIAQAETWENYTPLEELDKYRNPASVLESELYPNVDWEDETFKNYTMSYNTNISINGGTEFVKYFTSMDYLHEGDLFDVRDNGKDYTPGYGYNRLNFRSNLDFQLTKSTVLSTNLAGSYGDKQETWSGYEYRLWQATYANPPDAMPVQYSDGLWGYYPDSPIGVMNSVGIISNRGIKNIKTTILNTDFTLTQDLSMLTKGLKFEGKYSFDNTLLSEGGIQDNGDFLQKWISPLDSSETYANTIYESSNYDYIPTAWTPAADGMLDDRTKRRTFYQLQLFYGREFNKHALTLMGLFSRDEYAEGSEFSHYREDWVFRTTYNYDTRYLFEMNGSYNGSEQFGPGYQFDFFPSVAVGWMISNERFMESLLWLYRLKVRASVGLVGNDKVGKDRWLYAERWSNEGASRLGITGDTYSPYTWYTEDRLANPDVHWETVEKRNLGIELVLFNGVVDASVDIFNDFRTDVLIDGNDRSSLDYLGGKAPAANLGEVNVKGYEIDLVIRKTFSNLFGFWVNPSISHSKDEIIFADDPVLLLDYQKDAGNQIGQYRSIYLADIVTSWDEIYGTTVWETTDEAKLPGDYNLIDFNGDGIINDYDNTPSGYPERPQNTYNLSFGVNYREFSISLQFYGVNNVTRELWQSNFHDNTNTVFYQEDRSYNTIDNPGGEAFIPRYAATIGGQYYGNYFDYDGSYLRLKTAEIAYTFNSGLVNKMGMQSFRIYLNGNNLWLWTKMPDDRESNLGELSGRGAYPTLKRVNLGVNLTF